MSQNNQYRKKIMIARVRIYDYRDVVEHLERLHNSLDKAVSHDIVAEMKHMVPEYKSNNSQFKDIKSGSYLLITNRLLFRQSFLITNRLLFK